MTPTTTRIGLFVGLIFIVAFGFVVSEVMNNGSNAAPANYASNPKPLVLTNGIQDEVIVSTSDNTLEARGNREGDSGVVMGRRDEEGALHIGIVRPDDGDGGEVLMGEGERVALSEEGDGSELDLDSYRRGLEEVSHGLEEAARDPESGDGHRTVPPVDGRETPAEPTGKKYKIAPRDTLYSICRREYGSSDQKYQKLVMQANSITDERRILPGREIILPALPEATDAPSREPAPAPIVRREEPPAEPAPGMTPEPAPGPATGKTYVVKPRDTFYKISRELKVPLQILIEANKSTVSDERKLRPGMTLVVPI